jgi:hypothetical protein
MEASNLASGLCNECSALALHFHTIDFGITCRHVLQWNTEQGLENLPYDDGEDTSDEEMDIQQYRAITKVI